MIAAVALGAIAVGLILFACWAGSGGETSGKAGDSVGAGRTTGGGGGG